MRRNKATVMRSAMRRARGRGGGGGGGGMNDSRRGGEARLYGRERHPTIGEIAYSRAGGCYSVDRPGTETAQEPPPMLQKRIDDQVSISREQVREAQDLFYKHLKKVGLKHTDQRDTILRT